MVNTRIWNDSWVSEIDPLAKLLFVYFITNEHTNLSGIYELPLKVAGVETGVDVTMIPKMMPLLSGKVFYEQGWVIIKNFTKHQNTENPKIKAAIDRELASVPAHILEKAIAYGYPMHEISHSDLDLDSNSNSDFDFTVVDETLKVKKRTAATDAFIALFKPLNPAWQALQTYVPQIEAVPICKEIKDFDWWRDFLPKYAEIIKVDKYCPRATTPRQMVEKYANIEAYLSSNMHSQKIKKSRVAFV